ncbi:MAG: zinc-ribbon domain-containing protein [Eubacteriaceae bacterium]|nr:zinc-ribbon domain-containing protein [Eubacteriaceae bacterium]
MALFDKLSDLANAAKDKATEAVNMGKAGVKISGEKNALEDALQNLGQYYYEKYKAGEITDEAAIAICLQIDEKNASIAALEAEMQGAKANFTAPMNKDKEDDAPAAEGGTKFCTECGAKIPAATKFCPECGAKVG